MQRAYVFNVRISCATDRAIDAMRGMKAGGDGDPALLGEREGRNTFVMSRSGSGLDVVPQAMRIFFGGGPEEWVPRMVELISVQMVGMATGESELYSPSVALPSAASGPLGVVRG